MAQSFLEVARELIDSPEAKTEYAEDPDGFLAARDLEGLTAADLEVAVGFVAEAVPVPTARQLAAASPDAAPDAAALAQLAAATAVEEEVREAEPGSLGLAAVVDPGGELDLPDSVDVTTLTPAPEEEEAPEDAGAEGSNGEQGDVSGVDLPEIDETAETDPAQPALDESPGTADDGEEGAEGAETPEREERDFELDPEFQSTVDPTVGSDTGLSATGPVAEAAEVEPLPEETYEDLI